VRQVTYGARGRIVNEFGTTTHGATQRWTIVLYAERTWTTLGSRVPVPAGRGDAVAQIAQSYRDKLANRRAVLVGRVLFDGHETLQLRETLHFRAPPLPKLPKGLKLPKGFHFHFPAPPPLRIETWVDALTYLPVQTLTGPPGHQSRTETTWLPRTPANIAKTKLVIPLGFKRLVPHQGNGFSSSFQLITSVDSTRISCGQS
jgi:hypothetical protein